MNRATRWLFKYMLPAHVCEVWEVARDVNSYTSGGGEGIANTQEEWV